jgi:hypothetical protein
MKSIARFMNIASREERRLEDYKEVPCKDMDYDCFAFGGKIPFGNYERCYNYAPELGRCIFCEWGRDSKR